MAGHSKWKQIKHKKAANDLARGKVLTKHAKILQVVGRSDPNPDTNASLRAAVTNAKADGVPRDNIERVLKKLAGQGSDAVQFTANVYEGFGPAGVPVMVTSLTDNANRAYTDIRTAFNKNGGNLGSSGSVAFMFDHVGVIQCPLGNKDEEAWFEVVATVGGDDLELLDDEVMITTRFESLGKVRQALEGHGIEVAKSEPIYQAKDPVVLSESDQIKLEGFLEKLHEVDDVDEVFVGSR